MERTAFAIIEEKLQAITTADQQMYENTQLASYRLSELGFTNSPAGKHALKDRDVLKAKMANWFGCTILTEQEVNSIKNQFKLQMRRVSEFKDDIPEQNIKEILSFQDRVRTEKLNSGYAHRDYHCLLMHPDALYIVAPAACFVTATQARKASFSKEEWLRWLREDPIVLAQVMRWEVGITGSYIPTKHYAVITAWGLEALILENGTNQAN